MNMKKELSELVKKELIEKKYFSIDEFYQIVGYNSFDFNDFCDCVEIEEIPQYEVKEISLEQLCENASVEGGEEYYSEHTIEYYVEDKKIYQKIFSESLYKIKE